MPPGHAGHPVVVPATPTQTLAGLAAHLAPGPAVRTGAGFRAGSESFITCY